MPRTKKTLQRELTNEQLQMLVAYVCRSQEQDEEELRAEALLLLANEIEHHPENAATVVKRAAFALGGDGCMDAQIQMLQGEISDRYS